MTTSYIHFDLDRYPQPRLTETRMRLRRSRKPNAYDRLWAEFMDCLKRRDLERAEALRDQLREYQAFCEKSEAQEVVNQ
jgi:hypothetical protein